MRSPFDEARYRALLKGLDVAVVPLSGLERTTRIDAEFFQKEHLRNTEMLAARKCDSVASLAAVSDGNHFAISEEFAEQGIPYYRGQDVVGHFFIEQASPVNITEKAFDQPYMKRSHLQRGDVLLSIIGTIGESSLVTSTRPATCSCKLAILRPRDIAPEYLAVFLRAKHGRSQIERYTRGAVQMGLLLEDMDQIQVARCSSDFEAHIAKSVIEAQQILEDAGKHATEAERILLRALGLASWQPPEPLTYTRKESEAFAAERLDSEYFAPRVSELLERLGKDRRSIGDASPPRHERFNAGKSGEFDYIEIGGLSADGTAEAVRLPQIEAPSRATWHVHAGDVITSTVRPIRRLSALITPTQDGFVCSSGFIVLQPRSVAAEVLLTYLRLPPVCELMDLHTSASMYPAISEDDLLRIPFPAIPRDAETEVVAAVGAAHVARRRAHALLEAARRGVEIAIENSEATAIDYLKNQAR